MRIALASRQLATDPHSGIVRATLDLARGLHELGHRVHVLSWAVHDSMGLPDGVAVHETGAGLRLERAAAVHATLARLWVTGELDVASVPLFGSEGAIAVHDPRFPTVVSCMSPATAFADVNPTWAASADGVESVALERDCVQAARHLHGLTQAALDRALQDYGGTPLTARVVPRGLRDRSGGVVGARGGGGGRVELLFVGRLERRKGVDVLLDAVGVLVGEGLDVALTLVGPDSAATETGSTYREAFLSEASAEVAARVQFAGPVSDARLHELLAGADVVVQPSRYESHGIVLVEAMMFGRPIVTTTGGGIPEVVERDGNALLAEPGDVASLVAALRTVVGSAELRGRLGARSRALFLERFELGSVARAMADVFAEAVEVHAARPPAPSPAGMLTVTLDERAALAEHEAAGWRARAQARRFARLRRRS